MLLDKFYPKEVQLVEGDEKNLYNLQFLLVALPNVYEKVYYFQMHISINFVFLQFQQLELNVLKQLIILLSNQIYLQLQLLSLNLYIFRELLNEL
jgi:hypothetical protein